MFEKYKRRIDQLTEHSVPGEIILSESNNVMNAQFSTNPNYHVGMLYDWEMNPLREVDFLFHKVRDRTAEGKEVFYQIQFRPGFYPEYEFKDLYYRKDGKERFGFYIDVEDPFKGRGYMEKWLIMNKDQKVEFDRYNAFRCNWCFEWIYEEEYHWALGCVRDAAESSFGDGGKLTTLGGSLVESDLSMILPVTPSTRTILLGQKFIISDNTLNPQTYEISKIKDSSPLGLIRASLRQTQFNSHTDYYGIINDEKDIRFTFDLPIEDLPDGYGNQYHAICNCIKSKELPALNFTENIEYQLFCGTDRLYVDGARVRINLVTTASKEQTRPGWRFQVDGKDYELEDLTGYFEITEEQDALDIRCIHKDMAKYVLSVFVEDKAHNQSNLIELEVKL